MKQVSSSRNGTREVGKSSGDVGMSNLATAPTCTRRRPSRSRGARRTRRAARPFARIASSLALLGGGPPHGHTLVCAPVLVTPSVRLAGLLDGRVSQLAAPRAPWTVDDLPDALLVSQSVARLEKYREDRARHPQMLARGGELPTAPIFTH